LSQETVGFETHETAIYETPQACHSSFLPHKRRHQGRGFMA
jgi:hypothetical protein